MSDQAKTSKDMKASEAIEYIRNTDYELLVNFIDRDEERVTVLSAMDSKEKEYEDVVSENQPDSEEDVVIETTYEFMGKDNPKLAAFSATQDQYEGFLEQQGLTKEECPRIRDRQDIEEIEKLDALICVGSYYDCANRWTIFALTKKKNAVLVDEFDYMAAKAQASK